MAKKAKAETPEAEDEAPKGGQPQAGAAEPDAGTASEAAAAAAEAGAPGTEDGPSLDDLMPDLGDAIEQADAAERALLEARVSTLESEKVEMRDRMLRALAEAENTRRRAERDRRDAEAYGGTRLARDLLAVHDNLERALKAADDDLRENHGAFLEGVELTRRELLNAFEKHKIRKVTPEAGEKFDPNRHQAMFEAPIPGAPNGSIIEVMAPGFVISDRLLRPAMVGVARGGQQAPAAKPEAETGPKDEEPAETKAEETADAPEAGTGEDTAAAAGDETTKS